jgi:hypothetical protein
MKYELLRSWSRWASMIALLLVAVTQLYFMIFVFRPIAEKAALEESVSELELTLLAAEKKLGRLTSETARSADEAATLAAQRTAALLQTEKLDVQVNLMTSRKSELENLRTVERSRMLLESARARYSATQAAKSSGYAALRPMLVGRIFDRVLIGTTDSQEATQALISMESDDVVVRLFGRQVEQVSSSRCSFPRGCSPEVKEDGGSQAGQLPSGILG